MSASNRLALVVWLPRLLAAPGDDNWTAFLMSSVIACGAWAVLDGYRASLGAVAGPLQFVPRALPRRT
jgi:hypothetical protein